MHLYYYNSNNETIQYQTLMPSIIAVKIAFMSKWRILNSELALNRSIKPTQSKHTVYIQ